MQSSSPNRSTTANYTLNEQFKISGGAGTVPTRKQTGDVGLPATGTSQSRIGPKDSRAASTAKKLTGEAGHQSMSSIQTSPADGATATTHSAIKVSKTGDVDPRRTYRGSRPSDQEIIDKLKYDLDAKTEQYEACVRTFGDQMAITNQQLEAAQSELEATQSELEALRGFLSTYDDASPDEVSNLLQDINDRIEETARDNANRWLFDSPGKQLKTPLVPSPDKRLEAALGAVLVKNLLSLSSGDDCALFLLQSAWQACIVHRVRIILQAFSPVIVSTTDAFLSRLAQGIREGESQPTYGRWRALTHKYLRLGPLVSDQDRVIAKESGAAIAACHATASLLFKTCKIDYQEFGDGFAAGLKEVFTQSMKLAMMLQERVVSRDYRPLAPPIAPYKFFNEQVMERADTDSEAPAVDEVLCTVRLGMTFLTKQGQESTGDTSAMIFRPAEVLTRHCLEECVATA